MNISFDLDLTLIPYNHEFRTEPRSIIAKHLGIEPIRLGSPNLIKALQNRGHNIFIYTTSYRSSRKIRRTLAYYGIVVDYIITEPLNRNVLNDLNISASKYPPAFKIDLHIDDSIGVKREGEIFAFKTIIVSPDDDHWTETIFNFIN